MDPEIYLAFIKDHIGAITLSTVFFVLGLLLQRLGDWITRPRPGTFERNLRDD